MKDDEIRSMVEKILDQMLKTSEAPEHKRLEAVQTPAVSGECLEDITKTDLRRQLLVTDPADAEGYLDMKAKTPARLAACWVSAKQEPDTGQLLCCASGLTMRLHRTRYSVT